MEAHPWNGEREALGEDGAESSIKGRGYLSGGVSTSSFSSPPLPGDSIRL